MTNFRKLVPAHLHALASYKPGKSLRQAELESGVPFPISAWQGQRGRRGLRPD